LIYIICTSLRAMFNLLAFVVRRNVNQQIMSLALSELYTRMQNNLQVKSTPVRRMSSCSICWSLCIFIILFDTICLFLIKSTECSVTAHWINGPRVSYRQRQLQSKRCDNIVDVAAFHGTIVAMQSLCTGLHP